MEDTRPYETLEIQGEIEITALLRKYFTPIKLKIDTSTISLPPNIDVNEYLKMREDANNKSRDVDYTLQVQRSFTEEGKLFYHQDYNYRELASKVLFKMSESELSPDESEKLQEFLNNLFRITALYKEDYWQSYYQNYDDFSSNPFIQDAIEEIKDILNVLKMRDDIVNSEIVFRHKDKHGAVITEETTKVNDLYKEETFNYYAQVKYQNFLHRFQLTRFLTEEEKSLNIPIKKTPNTMWEFDKEIAIQIDYMEFFGNNPSCTTAFFEPLVTTLVESMSFSAKLSPLYEFLKLVVPALNNFIEDNAHEKYKKKEKHFLLFSILRVFDLVPNRQNLELNGIDDVKEDFIKQLIRK